MDWICRRHTLPLGKKTYIMGILNVTPDSFSDGGMFLEKTSAVKQALEMVKQGADILDIGGQSTRPGHVEISAVEEWERLESVLLELRDKINVPISVDTYFPFVAQKALQAGASIINDVSGEINTQMAEIVKNYSAGWVIMHSGGGDADNVVPIDDILADVHGFFQSSVKKCLELGLKKEQLCLDPGIGFGKTNEQNLAILRNVKKLKIGSVPLLVGASRKRVVGVATGEKEPKKRTAGSVVCHALAVAGGADIVRVHDVFSECQGAKMADMLYR